MPHNLVKHPSWVIETSILSLLGPPPLHTHMCPRSCSVKPKESQSLQLASLLLQVCPKLPVTHADIAGCHVSYYQLIKTHHDKNHFATPFSHWHITVTPYSPASPVLNKKGRNAVGKWFPASGFHQNCFLNYLNNQLPGSQTRLVESVSGGETFY